MKKILLLVTILLTGACATPHTMDSVAGEYKLKKKDDIYRWVFLENGVVKGYLNNKKTAEDKWSLLTEIHPIKQHSFFGKVIHIGREDGKTEVARINPDSSITFVAQIEKDGKRKDVTENEQATFIKNANKPSTPPLVPSENEAPTKGEGNSSTKENPKKK